MTPKQATVFLIWTVLEPAALITFMGIKAMNNFIIDLQKNALDPRSLSPLGHDMTAAEPHPLRDAQCRPEDILAEQIRNMYDSPTNRGLLRAEPLSPTTFAIIFLILQLVIVCGARELLAILKGPAPDEGAHRPPRP